MAKPVSSKCNLRCAYCYYLDTATQRPIPPPLMSDEVLTTYIRQYIDMHTNGEVEFCWHGGEPLLAGIPFFNRVVELQQQYKQGRHIYNVIQTNGTLLTDEWCQWLSDHQFLVGLSLDGPEHCHNHYRHTASGAGSFKQVMKGVEQLNQFGIEYNLMAVINDYTARYPLEVYRFLRRLGTPYLQFSPNVERDANGDITSSSVTPEAFGRFYCEVFDEWLKHDRGRVYIQLFDSTLASLLGYAPEVCVFGERCGHAAILEADGGIYCCDHFATKDYYLGNILSTPLTQMMTSESMLRFGTQKSATLSSRCRQCEFLHLCHGECPKNRLQPDEPNYLCDGYRTFFTHSRSAFAAMVSL